MRNSTKSSSRRLLSFFAGLFCRILLCCCIKSSSYFWRLIGMFSIRCLSAFIIATFIATSVLSQSLFSIGNSLTFDALRNFEGSYDHTINCNQNLDRIFNNPDQTCLPQLTGARPWDEAFENENYDFVTVQPFAGTSLSQDVAAISEWMRLQPDATFIIHTGWTILPVVEKANTALRLTRSFCRTDRLTSTR